LITVSEALPLEILRKGKVAKKKREYYRWIMTDWRGNWALPPGTDLVIRRTSNLGQFSKGKHKG